MYYQLSHGHGTILNKLLEYETTWESSYSRFNRYLINTSIKNLEIYPIVILHVYG